MLDRWNGAQVAIAHAAGARRLWAEVHPDEAVRNRADEVGQEVQKFVTDLGLDRELYRRLRRTSTRPASTTTRPASSSTRCATSAAPASTATTPAATRLRELSEQAVKLSQDFGRHIRDDVRTIRLAPERLDGLPDDYREAHPADDDGLVTITTDYPDLVPFMTFGSDGEARHELALAAEQRRLAGQRPGAPGPARRTPRDARRCSATTRGPTSTPRSR